MSSDFPKKCVVDTNIPKNANLAATPEAISDEMVGCIEVCVTAIENVIKRGGVVIDDGDEIFSEYRKQLSLSGQPGLGDHFVKWVHDNRWKFPEEDRVVITSNGDSFMEFPYEVELSDFDIADKKFVAVANAHPKKPPILQSTDCKWWGWKDRLAQIGITVMFLYPEYVEVKYAKKMKSKK